MQIMITTIGIFTICAMTKVRDEIFAAAMKLQDEEQWEEAIAKFLELCERDPLDPVGYAMAGNICSSCGWYERALPYRTKVIDISPHSVLGSMSLLHNLRKIGDFPGMMEEAGRFYRFYKDKDLASIFSGERLENAQLHLEYVRDLLETKWTDSLVRSVLSVDTRSQGSST